MYIIYKCKLFRIGCVFLVCVCYSYIYFGQVNLINKKVGQVIRILYCNIYIDRNISGDAESIKCYIKEQICKLITVKYEALMEYL